MSYSEACNIVILWVNGCYKKEHTRCLSPSAIARLNILISYSMQEHLVGIGGRCKLVSLKRNVSNLDSIIFKKDIYLGPIIADCISKDGTITVECGAWNGTIDT